MRGDDLHAARGADMARLHGLAPLVGNTPLLAIDFEFRAARRTVYAKLESMNLTGSVKDRMALHVLRRAYENGALAPGGLSGSLSTGSAAEQPARQPARAARRTKRIRRICISPTRRRADAGHATQGTPDPPADAKAARADGRSPIAIRNRQGGAIGRPATNRSITPPVSPRRIP